VITIFRLTEMKDWPETPLVNYGGQLVGEYEPVAENSGLSSRAWRTAASTLEAHRLVIAFSSSTSTEHEAGVLPPTLKKTGVQSMTGTTPFASKRLPKRSPLANVRRPLFAAGFLPVGMLCCGFFAGIVASREIGNDREDAREVREGNRRDTSIGFTDMGSPAGGAESTVEHARRSICLIEGSYIFRDKESGNVLRRADWILDGDDTVLETSYSGTGFLISSDGLILTNRHVAQPWWQDADAQRLVSSGYRPELKRLTAYFPGRTAGYRLTPLLTSRRADLAVLRARDGRDLPVPLLLGGETAVAPGLQVFVIGYPSGVGAIIGRSGREKIERIPGFLNFTDEQISQALAMRGLIEPFVSVGYLSNVANEVYTVSALTSGGSSGSPVLDSQGKVIAIHSASLTGVAGGGLAVPSRIARDMVAPKQ
jgi:hypothetical protein